MSENKQNISERYLSHRIINCFPRILNFENLELNSFVSREGPKARANKAGINVIIFILKFVENCL